MRFLLQLSFNGGRYHGWQVQKNARSVQEVADAALGKILRHKVQSTGCGRTDTGVHARQFFLHFDTEKELPENIVFKMNQLLPDDIAVQECRQVGELFHARFDATYREYEYHISQRKDPFSQDYAWYRYGPLDVDAMNEAAAQLLHYHDFKCFSKSRTQVNNFRCTIMKARWEKNETDGLLIFRIRANRFLRNMVRAVVGTLLECGSGQLSLREFTRVIESGDRSNAGRSVPAHGLYLTRIHYPAEALQVNRTKKKIFGSYEEE